MSGDGGVKRIGMRDVADAAGVSTQTVSRVLNDYPGIRDATRERVLAAVAALDYRVNNAARALGTSLTRTVGVVASDAVLHGPSAGIAALERAARARGRWISTAYTDSDDPADIDAAVRHLLDQGVDGIVLVAAHGATPLEGTTCRSCRCTASRGSANATRPPSSWIISPTSDIAASSRSPAPRTGAKPWRARRASPTRSPAGG